MIGVSSWANGEMEEEEVGVVKEDPWTGEWVTLNSFRRQQRGNGTVRKHGHLLTGVKWKRGKGVRGREHGGRGKPKMEKTEYTAKPMGDLVDGMP